MTETYAAADRAGLDALTGAVRVPAPVAARVTLADEVAAGLHDEPSP